MRNLMAETNMQVQMPVGITAPVRGATAFEIRFRDEKVEVIDITPRRTIKGNRTLPSAFQKRDLIPSTPSEASFRRSSRNFHNTYLGLDGVPQPSSKRNSRILMDDTPVAYRTSNEKLPLEIGVSQIPRLVRTPTPQPTIEGPTTCPVEPPKSKIPLPKKIASIEQKSDQNEVSAPSRSNNISPPVQSNIPQLQPRSKLRQRVYSSPAAMLEDELPMPTEPLPQLPQHVLSKIPKAPFKSEQKIPTEPLSQHTLSKIPKFNSTSENLSEALPSRDTSHRTQRDPQIISERSVKQTDQPSIAEITPPQIPAGPATSTKISSRTPMQTPNKSIVGELSTPTPVIPVAPVAPAAPAAPAVQTPATPASQVVPAAPAAPVTPASKSFQSIDEEFPPVVAKRVKENLERERERAEALRIEHEENMRRVERRMRHKEEAKKNAMIAAQLNSSNGPVASDFYERPIKSPPLEDDITNQPIKTDEPVPKTTSTNEFEMQKMSVVEQQNRDVETASQKSAKRRQRMNDDVKKNKFCCCVIS